MTTTIRNTANSAPGVYVYEVPSGSAPILGVGTSTAGFIGVFPDTVEIPDPNSADLEPTLGFTYVDKTINALTNQTLVDDIKLSSDKFLRGTILRKDEIATLKKKTDSSVLVTYKASDQNPSTQELEGKIIGEGIAYQDQDSGSINFYQGQVIDNNMATSLTKVIQGKKAEVCLHKVVNLTTNIEDAELLNCTLVQDFQLDPDKKLNITINKGKKLTEEEAEQIVTYSTAPSIKISYSFPFKSENFPIPEEVKLCTNFGEFKKFFGDFSTDPGQNILAHAVYGFFRNGGTRCYVVRVKGKLAEFNDSTAISEALDKFAAIDEIAIVAAPGITDKNVLRDMAAYIVNKPDLVKNWVAVFDAPEKVPDETKLNPLVEGALVPGKSSYAALYYPWIQVFDPVTKLQKPQGDGLKFVPPSGHMAGIYARVDSLRGVHKAPANESVLGAVGLKENISKDQQGALNKNGINCIRKLNGSFLVWGARTLGGDANGEFMYLNVRRLFNYLRKSIDEGTQWTVFEPNSPELWARIRRNLNAFLLTVWRSGALFGNTPEEAFYVKCDEETNPPELRDRGQVVIEIGVAIVKPAEFVIFNLSQWAGPGK